MMEIGPLDMDRSIEAGRAYIVAGEGRIRRTRFCYYGRGVIEAAVKKSSWLMTHPVGFSLQ